MRDNRDQKLERVLAAAAQLFAVSDFQHVCMEEIAARARVGKGTLYNLFESKEDLYYSIIARRLAELLTILERAYESREETLKNLRSLILHLHKFMSKHPHFYLIWKREESSIEEQDRRGIAGLHRRIRRLVLRVLQQGAREGVIRAGLDHELAARLLLGMVEALRKSPDTVYSREKSIDDLLAILLAGIGVAGVEVRVSYDRYRHRRAADGS